MKVLVVGKFGPENFAMLISSTLSTMGHNVIHFEPGIRKKPNPGFHRKYIEKIAAGFYGMGKKVSSFRRHRFNELLKLTKSEQPAIILVCHDFLWPQEVELIKRTSDTQVALWFPDAIINFGRSNFLAAPYDALFFKDPYIVDKLAGVLQTPVHYLPECYSPMATPISVDDLSSGERRKYGCDITTAGNMHAYRVAFFRSLADFDTKLWGNPIPSWVDAPKVAPSVQNEYLIGVEKIKAFLGAKIVINNMHPAEIWGVNCRTFEVTGFGGFLMQSWTPGLGQLFKEDEEVVSFRNIADLKDKIAYYLERPVERARIASAGQKRAATEHTYSLRLQLLIDTIEGRREGFPIPDIAMYQRGN